DNQVAAAFGVMLGVGMILVACRVEYRLANHATFRVVRHVIRLFLLSVFAAPWFMGFMGDAEARRASFAYMLSLATHPLFLLQQLANPVNLAVAAGVALLMHLLLTRATRLRAFWHRRLTWIGLK